MEHNQKKIVGQGGTDLTELPIQAFPALTEIRSPIQRELTRRKESFGKNNLPTTTWCRLISNSRPSSTNIRRGTGAGRKEREDIHILMGAGTLENGRIRGGFESMYGYRRSGQGVNEQVLRPTPGIENISITMEGKLGSLRRAKITWNAPSIFDLEELSPYFLTPGATAIIEWGWGIFTNAQVAALGFADKNVAHEMLGFFENPRTLFQRAISSQGLYDAMLGYITNFEWSANSDGSFTCTTEITTMGELMASVHLREQWNSTSAKAKDQVKTIQQFVAENLSDRIKNFSRTDALKEKGIDVITAKEISIVAKWFDKKATFVSWGFLEDEIINPTMAFSNEGKREKGGFFPVKIDSTNSFISNDPRLISVDKNILINHESSNSLLNFNDPKGDKLTGVLRHIYINYDFILKTFGTSETLKDFFEELTNIANNASSNIWRLTHYVDPLSERLRVIDQRYTNNAADNLVPRSVFSLGGFGKETVLKEIDLVSKLTSQLAMTYIFAKNKDSDSEQDTISNAKDDMGIKTLYGGFDDLVVHKVKILNKVAPEDLKIEDAQKAKEQVEKKRAELEQGSTEEEVLDTGKVEPLPGIKQDAFLVKDAKGQDSLRRYLHRKTEKNKRRKQQLFPPLELNLTIDGIGGIIPGNIFRIENIPEVYEKFGIFQVIRVEHDITPEVWNTNISAYFKIIDFDVETGDTLDSSETADDLNIERGGSGDDGVGPTGGGL